MGWFDAVPSERGVKRIEAAFEFLHPALDTVPAAVDRNTVSDTERSKAAPYPTASCDHHVREVAIEFLDLFEKPPCHEVASRRSHTEMDHLARCGVKRDGQHGPLTLKYLTSHVMLPEPVETG